MKSAVKNAADPRQVEEGAQREKRDRERELEDMAVVMSTMHGRRFLWRVINGLCHYDTNDAQHSGSFTYFSLGERNIGRIVKADAYLASHEKYQLMERENWALLQGDK
jgi:hypothetical protein